MEFKIGEQYAHANIMLIPLQILEEHPYASSFGRYPDYAIEFWRIQTVFHYGKFTNKKVIYEVYDGGSSNRYGDQYLYEDDWQERIDFDEIKVADAAFKRKHIEGIFELEEEDF